MTAIVDPIEANYFVPNVDGSWVALSGEPVSLHGGASLTGMLLPELSRPGLINAHEQGQCEKSSPSLSNLDDGEESSPSPSSLLTLLMSRPVRLPLLVASNLVILALGLFLGRRALLSLDASVTL